MHEDDQLAGQFEGHRSHLRAVAYRMLGSSAEADDAVQEAWLRLARSDVSAVGNLGGWLTRVTSRICLDLLRSRDSRREDPVETVPDQAGGAPGPDDPEQLAVLADSVGQALLVVLGTLGPAERVAFVLHDMFAVPFDEIATIIDRSPAATRQLATRARRRVQGASKEPRVDAARQRDMVTAFLAASQAGQFDALLALLDPDVVLRSDRAAAAIGATGARGAAAVAGQFSGRARGARLALIDGLAGVVWAAGGRPKVVFSFTITEGKIAAIDMFADDALLDTLELTIPG